MTRIVQTTDTDGIPSSPKILLVEDDAILGEDLCQTLRSLGYRVFGPINNGEEAVECIGNFNPDLILMDIGLSGKLDGIQTAELLQHKVALPVVFLTGLTDDESFQRAKLVNPYGYLIKPFDRSELRSTIELTLHRFQQRTGNGDGEGSSHFDSMTSFAADLNWPEGDGNEKGAITSYLSQLPLFKGVPQAHIRILARHCSIRKFQAGEFLLFEEDEVKGGFIPVSGRISVTKTSDSGKELIVALLAPGDVLGLQFSLTSFAKGLSSRTKVLSKVIWIPGPVWELFKDKNPTLHKALVTLITEELVRAYGLASSLAHASVEGRIVSTLVSLLPQFGKTGEETPNSGRIYITRRELAELTGTTAETAYRVTKHLERENLLDLTRPGILKIIDVAGLRQAAVRP